jgi:iron(III) transport system permease protein
VLIAAGAVGLLAVLGGGFAIGLQGWSFEVLQAVFGPLPRGQIGIGLGGALTLLALIVLLAAGVARLGRFRGDFFIAGSAPPCAALLLLVRRAAGGTQPARRAAGRGRALVGLRARGAARARARLGPVVPWLAACAAAWPGTRSSWRCSRPRARPCWARSSRSWPSGYWRLQRPLNILALLPIITPPFVVGLGLILLFGRAGARQPVPGVGLRHPAHALVLRPVRVWLAQLFAFTPIAFMISARRGAGHRPVARGGGADAARLAPGRPSPP